MTTVAKAYCMKFTTHVWVQGDHSYDEATIHVLTFTAMTIRCQQVPLCAVAVKAALRVITTTLTAAIVNTTLINICKSQPVT